MEQARQTNRYAVFFTHDRETIDYHYERNPDDPRVTHAMTLEVDEFGNGLKSVAIAYPRRNPAYPEQAKTLITYTENQVTNKPNESSWYRIGVPIDIRTYEITGLNSAIPFTLDFIVERVVATLHPNNTYEKVVFDPWEQKNYDVNDTVTFDPKTDLDVRVFFTKLPDVDYLPTWYQQRINGALGTEEKGAASKTAKHADTPTIAYLDTLGRAFLTVADNGNDQKYHTHVELDIEGNQRAVTDALNRVVMKYDYDLLGNSIHQSSMEAGERWMLNNVAGKPIRMWDSRNHTLRTTYDALMRPTQLFVKAGTEAEILAEKTVYGEGLGEVKNHRGRIYQHFDSAGVATNESFDFKGNLERSTRQLVQDYKTIPDWSGNPVLETEVFSSSTCYDAINRPIQLIAPHSDKPNTKINVIRPDYNEANLLERMDVWLGETALPTTLLDPQTANFHAVTNIDYNAKGQRTKIGYGNGAPTEYTYDEKTFRLTHLRTTRGSAALQDLFYTYDPVGNITRIRDDAQQTIFFKGQVVLPHCDYIYDAIYRLIEATGREHIGQAGQPETTWNDEFRVNLPHPNDGQAMRNYTEQYIYDAVGNFEKLIHQAANGNWTRAYVYNESSLIEPAKKSNRLSSTTVGQRTETYTYDAHGNMTSMPHLSLMRWNYKNELGVTSRQAVNETPPPEKVPETTFYVYDASGQRVRKVTERQNGTRNKERIYLGGFEIYHEFSSNGNDIKLERETLHIMDDKQRIALVETKTVTNPDDESRVQLIRFQFSNHLGSANLELDDKANVISYEEYYPYGCTSYQAVDKSIKVAAKRYRYTGMERDEETGLNYHGARYYIPWLSRWCSADPLGIKDGLNLYRYTHDNPVLLVDQRGTDAELDQIMHQMITFRNRDPASFVRFLGQNEVLIYRVLSQYGYHGSWVRDEAYLADFDAAATTWSRQTGNPLPIPIVRFEEPNPNEVVLGALPDGTGYVGRRRDYERAVQRQTVERQLRTLDNIRGGIAGAVGYGLGGDEGSDLGSAIDGLTAAAAPIAAARGGRGRGGSSGGYGSRTLPPQRSRSGGSGSSSGGRSTRPQPIESRGASTRGASFVSATAQTSRSLTTSIRADVGESQAYGEAIFNRSEIGIQRPLGANVPGVDFITAVRNAQGQLEILVTDVKTSTVGRFPRPSSTLPTGWDAEVRAAIAPGRLDIGNSGLEQEIRDAYTAGRVRVRQVEVDYSPTGQGRMRGF